MEWYLKTPIAHRGLHDNNAGIPENSLKAFEEAVKSGYPIEFDVHLLVDGELAVFHDKSLKRVTGIEGSIVEQDKSKIQKIKLFDTDHTIPILNDVLDLVSGKVPLLVEIKNPDKKNVGKLEKSLWAILKQYKGDYAVQCFNPYSLMWFKEHAPEVKRGQLSGSFKDTNLAIYNKILLQNLMFNHVSKPQFIGYDIRLLPNWAVNRCRSKGLPILGWTVKTEKDMEKASRYCDSFIFEGITPKK